MWLAAIASGVAVAALAGAVIRPAPPLAPRVRPYTIGARSGLGRPADSLDAVPGNAGWAAAGARLVEVLAARLGRLLDRTGDEALERRLRQAGLLTEVPEARRAHEYRVRQLASAARFAGAGGVLGLAAGASAGIVLLAAGGGFVYGATRWKGRVDNAIEDRRLRMQLELYTVNQLLAMSVRTGGGVVHAVGRLVARGRGEVVSELAEVLAAHRSGRRIGEAFEHAARATPEPHAARTYRLLASGAEHGADLAEGLRALSQDIRGQRAEALKRAATKRRAAMLLPIIAILAPVMLLFIGAPLPSIVFGSW
jgi:tight adherence protein C